eukprot:scaffold2642_cov120-Cylindrotheca_fusiformis.AAC.8
MSTSSASRKMHVATPSSARTRRLRNWLNHSVLAPASTATFQDDFPDTELTVTNIDQALRTNYRLTDFDAEESVSVDSEDFIYDHLHRELEEQKTQILLQQLKQSPLDFLKDDELLEEEWKWKFGSTGKQEYQFASFDDAEEIEQLNSSNALEEEDQDYANQRQETDLENSEKFAQGSAIGTEENLQLEDIGESSAPAISARKRQPDVPLDHGIDIPPTLEEDEDFGDFQEATLSPQTRPLHTPKSTDGVSTILNNFQLDFGEFPTPNTLVLQEKEMEATINPQEPDYGPALPTSISDNVSVNKSLTPRKFEQDDPSSAERKMEMTPAEEPKTPIIHNQSAKKTESVESPSQDEAPMIQSSLNFPESTDDDMTDPSVKMFTDTSPAESQGNSSIPSVVRVVAKNSIHSITESAPISGTVLFPSVEHEAYFNSSQSMQTAEGRFLRRQYSSKLDLEQSPEDDSSEDSGVSLRQFCYEASDESNVDQNILQILQKLEWDWVPYWQWDSLLYANAPSHQANDGLAAKGGYSIERGDEEDLEDWMIEAQKSALGRSQVVSSSSKRSMPTEENIPLFHEEVVQQLSHLDSLHVKICKRLHKRIQPHSQLIAESNRMALELGKNLQLCDMYLKRSKKSVNLARNGKHLGEGAEGALELVKSWQVHSAYTQLEDILESIQNVKSKEKSILDEIESYDACQEGSCRSILDKQLELEFELNKEPLVKLDCLRGLRERSSIGLLKKFQVRLHSCLESVAVRCCNSRDISLLEEEYNQLVQAIVQVSQRIHSSLDHKRTALEICTSLQTAWLLQTQRSFGLALLDPTDDPGDSEFDKELMALTSFYDMNVGSGLWFMDPSKVEVWKQNLVTIRLDFEIQLHPLPAVLHKLCVVLFQVLEECFDEYLKYIGKKKLFDDDGNDDDWLLDLEGLEDVVELVRQFLSLQSEFLEDIEVTGSANSGEMVQKKLHSESHFANFKENGNPFHTGTKKVQQNVSPTRISAEFDSNPRVAEILRLLASYCDTPDSVSSVPKCFSRHVVSWIARLLIIVKKLPSVTSDAMVALKNIFNLYITTAFRVCAGSSAHEQVLLGLSSPPIPEYLLEPASPRSSSPNLFGFGRRSSNASATNRASPSVAPSVDAELCAPLASEKESLGTVQNLIVNAQKELEGFVKLDLVENWLRDPVREPGEERLAIVCRRARILEARHAVSWSCVFLAATLHAARVEIHQTSNDEKLLEDLDSYVESFLHSVPLLLSMSNRISCIRAISGKAIVNEIITLGYIWEEAKLHEQSNQYIDSICDICSLLWCSLSNARNLPTGALNLVWENMVEGCYTALLDGFARVPFCSTEGRSLMSMDLASLTAGMQPESVLQRLVDQAKTNPPPKVTISKGMAYVDTYIKVFYFPPLDAFHWIEENYAHYQRNHTVALIAGASFSSGDRHVAAAKKVISKVQALYEVGDKAKVASV